jgi:hypothetical protein
MLSSDNPRLNEQPLDMIRLFKNPMPEEDFIQMKRLAVQLLSKHLDEVIDNWEKENNINEETYEKWSKEHLRSSNKRPE